MGEGGAGVARAAPRAEAGISVFYEKTKWSQPRSRKVKLPVLTASLGVNPAIHHGSEKAHLHSKYQKIRQRGDRGKKARPLGHAQATRPGPDFRAPSSPQTRIVRRPLGRAAPSLGPPACPGQDSASLASWLALVRTEDGIYITML